jgi:hypothetical protein
MSRPSAVVAVALACTALGGCTAQRKASWSAPPPAFAEVSDEKVAGLLRDGDAHWLRRQDPAELDAAGRDFEAASLLRPRDHGILVRLGRVAQRRGLTTRRVSDLDDAVRYAERALSARNPDLAAAARAGKAPDAVFKLAEQADAPALVLYAEALLQWARAKGTPTVMAASDLIRAAAGNAMRFDRGVGWAAPDRVLAILSCELPQARQNLGEARDHFEAAVAAAPAYLPTRLAFAEEYAPRVRDPELYLKLLHDVTAADARALPEAEAENLEAQATARALLKHAETAP